MSKIVFFDIDGTILNSQHEIPETTKKAVAELRDKGTYVAIATGRGPFMFREIRNELEIDTYVSMNGQIAVFNNESIYQYAFPVEIMDHLLDTVNKAGHSLVFMSHDRMVSSVLNDYRIEKSLQTLLFGYPTYEENYHQNHPVSQMLLFCEEGEEEVYKELYPMFTFIRWHKYALDVIPKGSYKAQGIEKIIHKLGFRLEDTYAFGDGFNDIEMLKKVGTGVAMGNAHPEVKQHADYITKHVDEDGILFGLKELGLL